MKTILVLIIISIFCLHSILCVKTKDKMAKLMAKQNKIQDEKQKRSKEESDKFKNRDPREDVTVSAKVMDMVTREECHVSKGEEGCVDSWPTAVLVADTNGGLGNQMSLMATQLAIARQLNMTAMMRKKFSRRLAKYVLTPFIFRGFH